MGKHSDDLPGGHYVVPFSQTVKFHGHICPGLAIGYYASHVAMRWLAEERSPDDEVFAIIDSAGCGADAVQAITGCTIGKGNLVINDNGKQVYTFGIRGRPKAIRIALRHQFTIDRLDPGLQELREKVSEGHATVEEVDELRRRIQSCLSRHSRKPRRVGVRRKGDQCQRAGAAWQCQHCRMLEVRRACIGCKGKEGRERAPVPRVL